MFTQAQSFSSTNFLAIFFATFLVGTLHWIWIREDFIYSSKPLLKTVIFGHTPTMRINNSAKPVFFNHKIAIDTGCVFGYALTALEIIDGKISNTYQVSNKAA